MQKVKILFISHFWSYVYNVWLQKKFQIFGFFGGEILQCLAPKKITSCTKDLFWKKNFESQHILKEKKFKLPYLDHGFL
jgi:hypothetical protein